MIGWSEQSRYETISEDVARDLVEAIGDPDHGVLQWFTSLW